ncbi:MAG: DNA polymerase III subunit tau [Chloroflexi bacterium ADurb.Bin180]|mgnify:CR=1 FL=1|nr:MAG: DNA polymerase III subunit tau [Chloroflexi bacterium ADurb.Bin180]HOU23376.1 DNA polymerase III subunit gamma/tau [Anaerolineae bacterium]HQJ51426.1 DNA polymerase III subunit gamma/tau [Anaerolineae bacterium]
MAAQAIYRRWRSRTFAELIGQEHVTQTLLNSLRAGRIGHAYLFTGPRGTGKTSAARIFAKAVNCLDPQNGEPCNHCSICVSINEGRALDLIEIDAASNRGIDEIRSLRDKIAFSPNECRYKVYVIDEVHMLTDPAFNALLKTLEEPPPHAIFVLATTEPQRIPLTVLSRCQRFDFRRVSMANLLLKLERICAQEGVRAQPEALAAIARHATGSFRDAESLLDQLVSFGIEEIKAEDVQRVLGSAPEAVVAGIAQAVISGDAAAGLSWINEALDGGVEARQLTREVLEYLRGLLLIKNGGARLLSVTPEVEKSMAAQAEALSLPRLLRAVRLFNGASNLLKTGIHTQLPLEMALVEASMPDDVAPAPTRSAPAAAPPREAMPASGSQVRSAPAPRAAEARPAPRTTQGTARPGKLPEPPPEPPDPPGLAGRAPEQRKPAPPPGPPAATEQATATAIPPSDEAGLSWLVDNWGRVLQAVRVRNKAVEAFLKSCEPISVKQGVVTLGFYHAWHRERMNEDRNRRLVEEALSEVAGRPYRVECKLYEGNRPEREKQKQSNRREEALNHPVIRDAIDNLGATVVDVQ